MNSAPDLPFAYAPRPKARFNSLSATLCFLALFFLACCKNKHSPENSHTLSPCDFTLRLWHLQSFSGEPIDFHPYFFDSMAFASTGSAIHKDFLEFHWEFVDTSSLPTFSYSISAAIPADSIAESDSLALVHTAPAEIGGGPYQLSGDTLSFVLTKREFYRILSCTDSTLVVKRIQLGP